MILGKEDMKIFEAVGGSHAYGTNIEGSDIDIRGVNMPPLKEVMGFKNERLNQKSDKSNDVLYYEIDRFLSLLMKANPNMLEMMNYPNECIRVCDPAFKEIVLNNRNVFYTKKCRNTLTGYAIAQIKKAKGLNKKSSNPQPKNRKGVLDFCYVVQEGGSVPLKLVMSEGLINRSGAKKIPNAKDMYSVWVPGSDEVSLGGLVKEDGSSNSLRLSFIPEKMEEDSSSYCVLVSYNKDAYTQHCKEWSEYWKWVNNRNELRWQTNVSSGAEYDTKNMMHCFRLINMGLELANTGELIVRRPDRQFLLDIRSGKFTYSHLIGKAEELIEKVDEAFENSDLPDSPDETIVKGMLSALQERYY